MNETEQVFDGLRVLDLSRWVTGEFCTKLFADFGADVVKIERPGVGSLTRSQGPFPNDRPDPEASALFLHLNTNKRSVALDLATAAGRDAVIDLAAGADLIVEAFRPGTMERLGLSWDVLHRANPRLVMTRISNFGQSGPYRDREATSLVLQAMGGPMHQTGAADRAPLRKPGHLASYVIGRLAGEASLAALLAVRHGHDGAMVDVSAHEVLLSGADRRSGHLMVASYSGLDAPRGGRNARRAPIVPSGPFPCRDGYVMLLIAGQFFRRLLDLLGDDDLTAYLSQPDIVFREPQQAWDRFMAVFEAWLAPRGKVEIMEAAEARHLPITAILPIDEVFAHPHYRGRGVFVAGDHPVAGTLEYVGAPWRMDHGWALHRGAPLLGEHTAEVLAERGAGKWAQPLAAAAPAVAAASPAAATASPTAAAVTPTAAATSPAAAAGPAGAGLPLDGVRIVDLTVVWSGPGATMLLGDVGAEVIRAECVTRESRQMPSTLSREQARAMGYNGAFWPGSDPGERPYNRNGFLFNWHARNKLSVTLPPLEEPEGRAAFLRLIEVSDVFIENNSKRTLTNLNLDYDVLSAVNPRIIVVRMAPLGLDGPMSDYIGYGPNFNSLVGIAAMDGYEGDDASSAGDNYHMDESSPAGAAFAVMAALWDRERTGRGQLVEFSQTENLMAEVGEYVLDFQMNHRNPPIYGNGHPNIVQGVFATAEDDRWLALSVRHDADRDRLAEFVGDGPADGLAARIERWAQAQKIDEALGELRAHHVPATEVMTDTKILDDVHLAARGWFQTRFHPEVGEFRYLGHPWRADGLELRWGRPFPALGEDNHYVYTSILGYTEEQYAAGVEAGTIGTVQRT